jgi:O-methyltransferase
MAGRLMRAFNAANLGYEISQSDSVLEPEFTAIYRRCREYSMTSKARMYALYKATDYVAKTATPGDIVECGVWRGGSVMLAALTLLARDESHRKLYLFDTFEGMSKPTEYDVMSGSGKAALPEWERHRRGFYDRLRQRYYRSYVASLEKVRANVLTTGYPPENLVFVKGKVEDTIPASAPGSIALLRLDTDWYESTKHELDCLYPRLSKNGVLIIDDYGCWAGAKKAVDEYFTGRKTELVNRIDWTGRISLKTE